METVDQVRGVRGRRNVGMERDIGARLRYYRERAGLSPDEMAARLEISATKVRNLETATNVIPIALLTRAARVLGVTVGDLYGPHDPVVGADAEQTRAAHAVLQHPETRALIEAYYAAPESVRETFSGLLKSLAGR